MPVSGFRMQYSVCLKPKTIFPLPCFEFRIPDFGCGISGCLCFLPHSVFQVPYSGCSIPFARFCLNSLNYSTNKFIWAAGKLKHLIDLFRIQMLLSRSKSCIYSDYRISSLRRIIKQGLLKNIFIPDSMFIKNIFLKSAASF